MGYLGIFGSQDQRLITDKLSKIMWFSTTTEWFNYGIVKGSKAHTSLDTEDIMILFYLFNYIAKKKELDVDWLQYPDIFAQNVKWAIGWAGEQKESLIFKYRPSEETKDAYKEFNNARWQYKMNLHYGDNGNTDKEYAAMIKKFEDLFELL